MASQQTGRRLREPRIAWWPEGSQAAIATRELASALRERIEGEVRFDDGSRALYATDSSNYRQVPIGVVVPRHAEDVVRTVEVCRRLGAPILARGGGTSLAGQCCNVAVVMDFSKAMHHLLELDPIRRLARVQPGIVLDDLRDAAERHHLTFGPDPATHNHCTLGGMIGNNSCGVHSVMAGRTSDNVESLEVLTYDGLRMRVGATTEGDFERIQAEGGRRAQIYRDLKLLRDRYASRIRERFPDIPRRVSGYPLDELLPEKGFHVARALVGTECTCALVLEAAVRLVPSPPCRSLLVLGYSDVFVAGDHTSEVMAAGPIGCEGIDQGLVDDMRHKGLHPRDIQLLPEGGGWLLVEFGGNSKQESDNRARALMARLTKQRHPPSMKLIDDPEQERLVWRVRESGLGATAFVPGKKLTWEGWEDSAVPPDKVGDYLRDLRKLLDRYGYGCDLYGHFGQGCIHTRIDFDLETHDGIRRFRSFVEEATDLVVSYGGSISGEHGDGQSKAEFLPKMYGPELVQAFREFKAIWDPDGRMNPGKVVDPFRIDQNLRLGTEYRPPVLETHFKFIEDEGSLAHATLRCVGVGECRKEHAGTMCPSYMVTREEKHSTRGRAHLLFEMLKGSVLRDGWRDRHVKEALDLCLACKGCKGECPVNVDMATYKAEFLAHHYEGRLRPMPAYTMGLIYWWSRLASLVPDAANFLTQTPGIRDVVKRLGGLSPRRRIPAFAPEPFTAWFRERGSRNIGGMRVLLWPDTFNNYLRPEVAKAAVEVLEAAGCEVQIPEVSLCCGRPLYDFGMLDTAERLLEQVLKALRPHLSAGTPIVGLEPSCVAVFRDELVNLFPTDEDAKRLKQQSYLLSEFLDQHRPEFEPSLARKAVVHGHCHHKAVLGWKPATSLLAKIGLECDVLDSGCCGMAGSFGFERDKYDVSMAVGERVLLPAVRQASHETLIVADGFSCREQIEQSTDRMALHTAQVLQMALKQGPEGPAGIPEVGYDETGPAVARRQRVLRAVLVGVGAIALGTWWWRRERRLT
jgi:FAD/FMN-containing dehydrogenase/Fe-S oxidoreductase